MGLCDEGRLGEARAQVREREARSVIDDINGLLECRNLLCMVERCAGNLYEALRIHEDSYELAHLSDSPILKARFHGGLGVTCRKIAESEGAPSYFERALDEQRLCCLYLEQAGDRDGAGDMENNVALALCGAGRTTEAREHLEAARRYLSGNPVKLAQVDDTEAYICLRESKPLDAVLLASGAVRVFRQHGEKRLLADALGTLMKATTDSMG
jgi:tetratricopeptide (TPR) repeat protein